MLVFNTAQNIAPSPAKEETLVSLQVLEERETHEADRSTRLHPRISSQRVAF